MYDGVGTQEVICGDSNYQNVLGRGFLKGVDRMVYDMLDEVQGGEYQVDYCILLMSSRFCSLNPTTDIHTVAAIRGRFYSDGRK